MVLPRRASGRTRQCLAQVRVARCAAEDFAEALAGRGAPTRLVDAGIRLPGMAAADGALAFDALGTLFVDPPRAGLDETTTGIASTFDRVVDVRPAYRALGLSDDAPRPVNLRAFRLANAFGAFGSVNDRKNALVIEGKRDGKGEDWREYDFRALPADPTAKLRQVSPWHWRLDWQLWISACRGRDATTERWFLTLLHKLATNDEATSSLLNENPFAAGDPPSQVRVSQYTYKFAPLDDPDGRVWTREQSGVLLKPTNAASLKAALDK